MKNYWVYLRVRIPVVSNNEKEAEAVGLKEFNKLEKAELRKIGVFENTKSE